jgi:hypothetical protein
MAIDDFDVRAVRAQASDLAAQRQAAVAQWMKAKADDDEFSARYALNTMT